VSKLAVSLTMAMLLIATSAESQVVFEVAAAGGFVGLPQVDVQSQPACRTGTGTTTNCEIDTEVRDFQRIEYTAWKPAVSTGVVLRFPRWGSATDLADKIGVGFGAHIVYVPGAEGSSAAAPAATVHFGTGHMQVFAGLLWTPADKVTLPNGQQAQLLPANIDPTQFIHRGVGGRPRALFAGIVISGLSIGQ